MAQPERPLSPFMHYRWLYTNTLSILHRITGVAADACFLLLVYWLVAAARGPDAYAAARCTPRLAARADRAARRALAAFCYHLLNGIRHLFWDAGYGFELPAARKSGWAVSDRLPCADGRAVASCSWTRLGGAA